MEIVYSFCLLVGNKYWVPITFVIPQSKIIGANMLTIR